MGDKDLQTRQGKIILFQGDSITDGGRSRNDDPNHWLGHGYAYLISAKLGNLWAEKKPVFYNRGVSGDRMSDLYGRWNEDTIALKPDILSILAGVNDIIRTLRAEERGLTDRFERAFRHVLEETAEVLPDTKLVLCEPFILNTGAPAEHWEEWQARIRHYQQVVRTLAGEFGAVFVPFQHVLDEAEQRAEASYWLWDGVHPTAAAHDLLAEQWLEAVTASGILND
ncbi:SGNH/GDSL hydrolase family protein [Paenibacillus pinistramenti]|uniref:SGNH/GDSL hydrolase family protein n=1 Tax=Paenibacillus pinistramenti TaxID=1768003 RepID=UPI001107B68B|nr:SGNH/GDSL hydrolase family protein [Paenibacillus pinistramenti]